MYRLLAILLACCGRVGFDGVVAGDGMATGDGPLIDAPAPDAPTACVADGFCVPSCGATDPDCQSVCGDGACVGNAGESCAQCAECRTTANVCGNGTCQSGEDGNSCFTDCGPTTWTWAAEEDDLIVRINQARTQGTSCNGQPATTAPAVTLDVNLRRAARDLAWEEAHLGGGMGFNRCNGQSLVAFMSMANANGSKVSTSSSETTNAVRLSNWIANMSGCALLMDPNKTVIGVGIAVDTTPAFVALFR